MIRLRLYAQVNGGPWEPVAEASTAQRGFEYKAPRDGKYVLGVMGVYNDHTQPASPDFLKPEMRVIIDSRPPTIVLRPTVPQGGVAGVTWDIADENLDLRSFSLEYRWPGQPEFLPLEAEPRAQGGQSWRLTAGQKLDIRLRVKDLAGNPAEQTTVVSLDGTGRPSDYGNSPHGNGGAVAAASATPQIYYLNTKKISIDLKIARKGISGVSKIDLYYCITDSKSGYQKAPNPLSEPTDPDSDKRTLTFDAEKEGLYGFFLLPHSGVGLADREPGKGDPPRFFVEVDTTKPVVTLEPVKLVHQGEGSYLDIKWKATDKNLNPRPIDIEYSETGKEGTWMEVAHALDNTGRYTWPVPTVKPFKFFVRVRAVDRAGNSGEDVTKEQVTVDLVTPQVEIERVEPHPSKP
jgi:hypothetical protein